MIYKYIKDPKHIENIIDLFLEFIQKQPEQQGKRVSFTSGYLHANEGYKLAIFVKASDILETKKWNGFSADEIIKHAIRAMNISENNLVHWQQKTLFADKLKADPESGSGLLYKLFCTDNDEESLEDLAEFFGRRYDLLAYLFFIKDPDQYYPCRPRAFKSAFESLGIDTECFNRFDYDHYVRYNDALRELAAVYSAYADHISVIDAHSFAWIIGNYKDVRHYIFETEHEESTDLTKKKEKKGTVNVRLNQSEFRRKLIEYWDGACAITGCTQTDILIASHTKPWKACELNSESASVYNGFLLTPNLDALFDAGYISFDDNGSIMISSDISDKNLEQLGVSENMRLRWIDKRHIPFFEYHRNNVFKR